MTDLTPLYLAAPFILYLAAAMYLAKFYRPRIEVRPLNGPNASNTAFRVVIDPAAPLPMAVAAQELWESEHKRGALLRPLRFINLLRSKDAMELMGHEVEVQAAAALYGQVQTAYRRAEAERMKASSSYDFGDWPVEKITAAMEANTAKAQAWLLDNGREIERARKALG